MGYRIASVPRLRDWRIGAVRYWVMVYREVVVDVVVEIGAEIETI